MNKKLIEQLLNTKSQDDFLKILFYQDDENNYFTDRDLWVDEVIDHFIKLFNITREEFEKSFFKNPPIDDFDDEDTDE